MEDKGIDARDQQFLADEQLRLAQGRNLVGKVLTGMVIAAIAWFIWRPLGATLGLLQVGYLRQAFRIYGEFWTQAVALTVGLVIGLVVAGVTRALQLHTGVGWMGATWLGLLGFCGVGYIGYGASPRALEGMSLDRNPALIQMTGTTSYIVTLVILLFVY